MNDFVDELIEFPDYTYTNQEYLSITVNSDKTYSLSVEENGIGIFSEDNIEPGECIYDIPLRSEGENTISFVLVDENGNACSKKATFYKDTIAPELSLSEDYNGASTYDSVFTISGTVKNYDSFELDQTPVEVADDGTFSCDLNLQTGNNEFYISASDEAGNVSSSAFMITLLEKKETNPVSDYIFIISILLITFFLLLVIKRFKNCKIIKKFGDYITTFLVTSAMVIVLVNFVWMLGCVTSGSMEPTLMTGSYNVSNRLAYVGKEPQRGDIITFYRDDIYYTKRVIGISGDEIRFADGNIYLNGEKLDESDYLDENVKTYSWKKFIVPEGYVFVLGDNREKSTDSRAWDNPYVSTDEIVSKYLFTIPLLHTSRYTD